MDKLKPCAHCGSEVELVGFNLFWVRCNKCCIKTAPDIKEKAIRAWNRRAFFDHKGNVLGHSDD